MPIAQYIPRAALLELMSIAFFCCCRFEPFNVIQADLPQPQASSNGAGGFDPAGQATDAFRALAGFLFGKNKEEQKFSMTMPVITDTTGHMRFILPSTIKVRRLEIGL